MVVCEIHSPNLLLNKVSAKEILPDGGVEGTSATLYAQSLSASETKPKFKEETTVNRQTSGFSVLEASTMTPHNGVLTLFGYGIHAQVDQGHLLLEDGIGPLRRRARFPRVGHGLQRLVVIGADGMVSLAALRWLADQDAAFVMLDRDGSVLVTTGPVRPSDARLRRAQALANQSGAALWITRELIKEKLMGQERVARDKLHAPSNADAIAEFRAELDQAETPETIRIIESQAGAAFWSAWRNLPVLFPKNDQHRIPDHWRTFGSRISRLSRSPRLASNPPNAILNYLYAVLESESRLAVAALGLDPGLGFLHVDAPNRDSLACDLMEPVRPLVDGYVLDWITTTPLKREWFFEERSGNCRLMGSFAVRLSQTAPMWRRAVERFAEWIARTLSHTISKPNRQVGPPTRLTQSDRRDARPPASVGIKNAHQEAFCLGCGKPVAPGRKNCASCAIPVSRENLRSVARDGRVAAQSSEAQARRSASKRRHDAARNAWNASTLPSWLDEGAYKTQVLPGLAKTSVPAIASAIAVSIPYATEIRSGKRTPHPRHWEGLAELAGTRGKPF